MAEPSRQPESSSKATPLINSTALSGAFPTVVLPSTVTSMTACFFTAYTLDPAPAGSFFLLTISIQCGRINSFQIDGCEIGHAQELLGAIAQVDGSTSHVGSAIIDAYDRRFARTSRHHTHRRA